MLWSTLYSIASTFYDVGEGKSEIGAERIGKGMYLFRSPIKECNECLISAHGGYYTDMYSFYVPTNVVIKFYGPQGNELTDPGVDFLVRQIGQNKKPKVFEELSGKKGDWCTNYILSKYQTNKKTCETYKDIRNTIDIVSKMYKNSKPEDGIVPFHVLTIRNRLNLEPDVNLKNAIDAVQQHDKDITVFHCSFCRSCMFDLFDKYTKDSKVQCE
jgi:hypothetical protein